MPSVKMLSAPHVHAHKAISPQDASMDLAGQPETPDHDVQTAQQPS